MARVVDQRRLNDSDISLCEAVAAYPSPPLPVRGFSDDTEIDDWVLVELGANEGVFYPAFEKNALNRAISKVASKHKAISGRLGWFSDRMAKWKQNSGGPQAAEYEGKVSKALSISGEIRGHKGREEYTLNEVERKAACIISKFSKAYLDHFFDDSIELYRGLHYNIPELARDILENPPGGEELHYDTYSTALVNFTIDKTTAKEYGILYTSETFSQNDILVVPDALFYEDNFHDRNSDGEVQVKGSSFDKVAVSELYVPETEIPLTETLQKLKEEESGKNRSNQSDDGSKSGSSEPRFTDLLLSEHQIFAGLIIRMTKKNVSISDKKAVDCLQRWVDLFQKLEEHEQRSITRSPREDIEELDVCFKTAIGKVTNDKIEFSVNPEDPAEIF